MALEPKKEVRDFVGCRSDVFLRAELSPQSLMVLLLRNAIGAFFSALIDGSLVEQTCKFPRVIEVAVK